MSDNIIVLPRDDVAAFFAAVADLEQVVELNGPFTFYKDGGGTTISKLIDEPVKTLSRIASDIDQQVSTQ